MSSEETTLNSGAGGDAGTPAESSSASGNFDAMIPTMPEDATPPSAETLNTEGEADTKDSATEGKEGQGDQAKQAEADPSDEKEAKGPDGKDPEIEPFHNHPRFQQLIQKNKTLETQLQEMRQQMESLTNKDSVSPDGAKPVEDTFSQKMAEIQEKLEEGEMSVSEAMAQQQKLSEERSQAMFQQILKDQAREAEVKKIQENFLKENADFLEIQDKGELQTLMEANPLHDELSAYYAYKASQVDDQVKQAVDKAVKETEDRLRKEFQSKRHAASLGGGASHVPNNDGKNPALNDTKKFGGKTTVLADMLKKMRAG